MMAQDYIERRGNGYYFIGSRVSLDSVVYQFLQGESPEGIAQAFPSLSLVQVYGGVAYYLERRGEIDAHLKAVRRGSRRWLVLRARRILCFMPSWTRRSNRRRFRSIARSLSG